MNRSKWEYKKLQDICDKGSSNIAQNKIEDNTGNYALYGASGYVKSIDFYHQDQPYIGVVKDGSGVGRANLYPAKSSLLGTMQYILPKKGCDLGYLLYVLQGLHLEKFKSGAAIPHIYFKDYGKREVPFPPISDQQRIVAELDCLNEMIAVKQEQLKEFDKLAQSIFYDMFGDPVLNEKRWEIRPLGELISIMGGFAFKSSSYVDIGIRLVQIANVWEDNIKWDEITHVPKEDVNKRPDYLLKPGDIVMALTRPIIKSLGSVKIARIRNCDIPCALNQRVCKFAFSNSLLSPHWFYHFARTDYFKDMINSFSSKGMQPNVSTKEIESILTPYIPLTLQQQFAEKISAIEAQKELVKQSIVETQKLLDYTMDKYFGYD